MRIRILFFGRLRELAGQERDTVTVPDEATLADILDYYQQRIPRLKEFIPSIATSVNQEYASLDTKLRENDEVALLPPVSGGSCDSQSTGWRHVSIVREPIATQRIADTMKRPEDGAVALFEGIVRNHSRGRRTLYLDYEAYEEMALKQMEDLAAQALGQFAVQDIAIIHRLGRLEIGETSVLIVVAAAHRAPAFDACRWLIDTLKRTVPIWKKEHFEDGAIWADGEPFPDEISHPSGSPAARLASK